MAHSLLTGLDRTLTSAQPAPDTTTFGPSDSTDSASDMAGLDLDGSLDQTADDVDAMGTGERLGLGVRGAVREAADILPDRVVDEIDGPLDEDMAQELADEQAREDAEGQAASSGKDMPQVLRDMLNQPSR